MSSKKKAAKKAAEPVTETLEEVMPAPGPNEEELTGQCIPAQQFLLTGPVECSLVVNFHYVESGLNPTEVKVLTKEFKGGNFTDVVATISQGVRRLVAMVKPAGGYLVKIHPRKLTVQGFSDAAGVYQHERAMSALSGVIYLMAFGQPK